MKTKLFALAFLFASSVLFAADQLCINITGMSPGSVLTPAGATDGFQFGVPNWVKNLPGQKDGVLEQKLKTAKHKVKELDQQIETFNQLSFIRKATFHFRID